jgi:hypothetical protein
MEGRGKRIRQTLGEYAGYHAYLVILLGPGPPFAHLYLAESSHTLRRHTATTKIIIFLQILYYVKVPFLLYTFHILISYGSIDIL